MNTFSEQPPHATENQRRASLRLAPGSSLSVLTLALVALLVVRTAGHAQIAAVLMVLWVFAFLLVGCGAMPHWLLKSLQRGLSVPPPPPKAGEQIIIALLGDGTVREPTVGSLSPGMFAHSRIATAVRLYREAKSTGQECTIIVAGDDSAGRASPPTYLTALATLGVEKTDVRFVAHGTNTYAHARAISEMLRPLRFGRLVLVTSGLHMKRAAQYFRNVGMEPVNAPSDIASAQFTVFPNAYNFAMTDIASHQLIGMLRMRVYNMLGWNK